MHIFGKNLTNHALIFSRLDEKRNLLDFSKKFLRKLLKMHYFSIVFKKLNKPCVDFLRIWKVWEILRKFSNIFLKEIAKRELFGIFFKRFNNPCVYFSRVWTKNANCCEILTKFDENSIEKLNFFLIIIFWRICCKK